ncbi:FAD-dependent oxidoreductase [Kocuria sp. HSID16901]|uniref:FAD-dependent oxidoreductase n=1 Tax=Kocuria sp. HSID16901 TaxID=2419505 RepID=UPI000660EF41|nr:FAD-dependent oxidoreductase [Kocuria sp. HSID16901]
MTTELTFEPRDDAEQHEADLVVLGAGGTGIAAALAAAERGVRVVLLEKGNRPGGAAMFGATGFAAYESEAQRDAGETFSARDAFHAITEYNRHRCNEKLVREIVGRSGDTVSWLASHGLKTTLAEHDGAHHGLVTAQTGILTAHREARTYHRYVSKFGGFKKMLASFAEMGGVLLTETAATDLVTGQEGEILGIRAEKTDAGAPLSTRTALSKEAEKDIASDENQDPILVDISTRAVVVGTGGFVGDHDLVQRVLGSIPASEVHFTGERKAVGTGGKIAVAAGGVADDDVALDIPAFTVPGRFSSRSLAVLANLPLLWVNRAGKRFVDEAVTYRFGHRGSAVQQQGGQFWMILDSATVERLATDGLPHLSPAEDHGAPLPPGTEGTPAQPQLVEALGEAVDCGSAYMGTSVEELAGAVGFQAQEFAATVDRYNHAVETGRDEEFFSPEQVLQHGVSEGPFYAVKVVNTVRGTLGGIRIDERTRVLDAHSVPVPGLFAGGNEATGFYGGTYPQIDGLTLAFAFNSGRIAGEAAADYLAH